MGFLFIKIRNIYKYPTLICSALHFLSMRLSVFTSATSNNFSNFKELRKSINGINGIKKRDKKNHYFPYIKCTRNYKKIGIPGIRPY